MIIIGELWDLEMLVGRFFENVPRDGRQEKADGLNRSRARVLSDTDQAIVRRLPPSTRALSSMTGGFHVGSTCPVPPVLS